VDIKELLVVFFYNQIKEFAERFAGTLGMPVDYLLLAIGYWKRDTWWVGVAVRCYSIPRGVRWELR